MQNSEETVLNDISEKLLRVNLNENVDSRLKKLALSGLIDDGLLAGCTRVADPRRAAVAGAGGA